MEEKQIFNEMEDINDSDNLGLTDIYTNTIPTGIIFPNELNQYLQGQVQFLLHTKGMLERRLSENEDTLKDKSKKISKLTGKIAELEQYSKPDSMLSGNPVHLMSAKIVELSKKLKDKTVENESLKTKYTKIQQKLNITEKNLKKSVFKNEANDEENSVIAEKHEPFVKQNYIEEVRQLQEKLSQTTNKLFDVKNKNIELKNEIKSANKLLQQELGESFTSILNFASSQTNWRGRAQQIIHLQQKNSELQDKIAVLSLKDSVSTLPPKPDGRKQMIEQQEKEINNNKDEIEDLKRRLSAAKSRVKVLENECGTQKIKLGTLSLKVDNDQEEIKQLQNKIHYIQEQTVELEKSKERHSKKLEDEMKTLKTEIERDNFIIENLQKNLEEKNIKIKDLSNEKNSNINNSNNISNNNNNNNNNNINNNNNKKRTTSSSSNDSQISTQSGKLETSKLQVLEVERKRLLELVDVLNARVKDERDAHSSTQINYKKERQKAAKLETKISRMELENSLNSSFSHSYSKSLSKNMSTHGSVDGNSVVTYENLKNSLELAEENVNLLKSKLDIIQKEKDTDLQKFSQIISESSSMYLKYNSPESMNQSTVLL